MKLEAPDRILVRGVNWLGDAVMTTPALQRLREAYPRARITILTPARLADLFQSHPAVDEVLGFGPNDGLWKIARRLRQSRHGLGLIFPNSQRSALELWLGRVKCRIGVARPFRNLLLSEAVAPMPESVPMVKRSFREIRGRVADSVSNHRFSPSVRAHHLYHYLHLAAAAGASPEPLAPSIPVSTVEIAQARERFDLAGDRWFGLNPGAEYGPAKRWPAERFATVAAAAQKRWNCRWMILGGKGDVAIAEEIARRIMRATRSDSGGPPASTPMVLAGRTSLRELLAVLRICGVVLTNDTGPMHLAAAVGTPVVGLFGSTSPELTGPGLPGDGRHALLRLDVPCSPCFRRTCPIDFRCMLGLDTQIVLGRLAEVAETIR
jgi:heptosyltransferase-2